MRYVVRQARAANVVEMGERIESPAHAVRVDEFVLGGILGHLRANVFDGDLYGLQDFLADETQRCSIEVICSASRDCFLVLLLLTSNSNRW